MDPATIEKKNNLVSGVLDHRPGARNVANDINGIRILDAELRAGNRFQEINMADLQRSIRQTFFVDDIKRLISAEGPNPQKTAFEVAQRLKLLYQILGPVSGRFESEGQKTNINRTGALLDRMSAFIPPPPELAGQKRFDIEYDSPLSRAQRDDEALSIQQYVGSDIPLLMQVDPTTKNIPDAHLMARHLAEIRGVQHEIRDQDEVDKITELENQVLSLQQALAAASQTAEAVGKLGPVLPYVNGGQGARRAKIHWDIERADWAPDISHPMHVSCSHDGAWAETWAKEDETDIRQAKERCLDILQQQLKRRSAPHKILADFELRDEPSFEEFQASVQRLFRGPDAATILLYMQVESHISPVVEGDTHATYFNLGVREWPRLIRACIEGKALEELKTRKNVEG